MGPFDRQETKEVLFHQLGDAFRYGMTNEIEILFSDSNDADGTHLYASIAYMYLNGLITRDTTAAVYGILLIGTLGEKKIKDIVEAVSKEIFGDLLNKYHFNNLNDLVDWLNDETISDWYFDIGFEIVGHSLCGIFLYDKHLYFIANEDGDVQFVKLNPRRIDKDECLDKQGGKTVIGCGYSRICGFDEKLRRVYLGVKHQDGFYHYYDMISNEFVVCSNELLTVRNGIPYIITKDNYFAYVLGEDIRKIKIYHDYEKYVQKKDCFFVVPKSIDSPFFYPYCITFDGKVIPADIKDCRKYIWNFLEQVAHEDNYRYSFFSEKEGELSKVVMPEELTIDSVLNAIRIQIPSSELCTNKKYMIFENLCDLLGDYVNPVNDMTQLLYTLYDINRIMDEKCGGFPSEELYWRFKDVNESREARIELKDALTRQDYEVVKRIILGDTPSKKSEGNVSGLIGEFWFNEDGIQTRTMDMCYGVVVGNQIVFGTGLSVVQGMVSYDCGSNMFYITSDRFISKEDKMQIVKDYKLSEQHYVFVVQRREKSVICEVKHKSADDSTRSFESICDELDENGYMHISSEEWESLFASAKELMVEMLDDED